MANRSRNNKDANIDADLDRGWQLSHACQCCVDIIALSSPKCPAAAPSPSHAHYTANPAQLHPPTRCCMWLACGAERQSFDFNLPSYKFWSSPAVFLRFFHVVFLFFRCFDPSCKYTKKKTKKRANVNHSQDGSRSSKNVVKDLTSIGTTTCFGHISRMPSSSSSSSSPETTATIDGVGWWK